MIAANVGAGAVIAGADGPLALPRMGAQWRDAPPSLNCAVARFCPVEEIDDNEEPPCIDFSKRLPNST